MNDRTRRCLLYCIEFEFVDAGFRWSASFLIFDGSNHDSRLVDSYRLLEPDHES